MYFYIRFARFVAGFIMAWALMTLALLGIAKYVFGQTL